MRESFTSPTGTTTKMARVTVDHTDPTLTPAQRDGLRIRGESFEQWRVIREKGGAESVHLAFDTEAACDSAMDECKRQNDALVQLMAGSA